MSKVESNAGELVLALLDPERASDVRIAAARALSSSDEPGAFEALIRVAQQIHMIPELAPVVGRSLAQIAFRREVDMHELDMANCKTEVYDAYDAEIARLQRLSPHVRMKRAS